MDARILYLHAITPVHAGTGQTVAVIDLPIAREKATNWPQIPASSVKGVLRDALLDNAAGRDEAWVKKVFGEPDGAGDLCFGDQRVLCLAVRSYFGTFAYVTCPLALTRFARDLTALGLAPGIPTAPPLGETQVAVAGTELVHKNRVFLEDLDLAVHAPAEKTATDIAGCFARALFDRKEEQDTFIQRFAVVSDRVFDFLCETATEVTARVRLNDQTKTVEKGGLWYEEAVPAETVFWGPVIRERRGAGSEGLKALSDKNGTLVQLGGKSSVGRGFCRMLVQGGSQP